ncbi:MAG: hypothetical protein IPO17_17285 [Flavobacteriales bacterium]|nr:hypothetical protein [Flavobacteriales bacterium]
MTRTTMKTWNMNKTVRFGLVLLALSLLAMVLLPACSKGDDLLPSDSVDDNGSGGHGSDDGPGDDNGGGG